MENLTILNIDKEFKKTSGVCLLFGSLLATTTMIIHPVGGSVEHIVKLKSSLVFSHSIAIFCLPFISFGFWGLSQLLKTKSKISILAFIIFSFGLFAAMIAATINGFTLPYFASNYVKDENDIATIKKIIDYGKFINIPMALIFITATSLCVCIWSILIIKTNQISKGLGYFGLIIISFGLIGVLLKFNLTSLLGFRTFTVGLVIWILFIGVNMLKIEKL